MFPDVMPAINEPAHSLTVYNASSTDYTLTVMTWVAVVLTPVVLGYQAWSYWVFRKRISTSHIPEQHGLTFTRS
jgi:cytochrome d ubiquinol oxidase subunit II